MSGTHSPRPHTQSPRRAAFASRDAWAQYLRDAGLRLQVWPDQLGDLSRVEFAICWNPQPGLLQQASGAADRWRSGGWGLPSLRCTMRAPRSHPPPTTPSSIFVRAQCPHLRAIQSMGAGVDSMLGDDSLPRHVPLLRVIDPLMSQRMATWVLWGVINCQVCVPRRAAAPVQPPPALPAAHQPPPPSLPFTPLPDPSQPPPTWQRKCDAYWEAQREARWAKEVENFRNVDNEELHVGVMGLGE